MKKRTKVLIIIAVLWSLIVLVDFAATNFFGSPILSISVYGGDVVSYYGLGYVITILYPLVRIGEVSRYYEYSYLPFIIGISLLALLILYDVVMERKKTRKQ